MCMGLDVHLPLWQGCKTIHPSLLYPKIEPEIPQGSRACQPVYHGVDHQNIISELFPIMHLVQYHVSLRLENINLSIQRPQTFIMDNSSTAPIRLTKKWLQNVMDSSLVNATPFHEVSWFWAYSYSTCSGSLQNLILFYWPLLHLANNFEDNCAILFCIFLLMNTKTKQGNCTRNITSTSAHWQR